MRDARSDISKLAYRAERGERITITRAGRPVTQLGLLAGENREAISSSDLLLILDKFALEGPGGKIENLAIDRLLYRWP